MCVSDCVLCARVCVIISVLPGHESGSVCCLCARPAYVCINVCSMSMKGPGVGLPHEGVGMIKLKTNV